MSIDDPLTVSLNERVSTDVFMFRSNEVSSGAMLSSVKSDTCCANEVLISTTLLSSMSATAFDEIERKVLPILRASAG